MAVLLENNAAGRLALNINATQTTINLQSGSGSLFPNPGSGDWFPITIVGDDGELEIAHCTSRTGDSLTVSRGAEGTQAREFDAGNIVELRLTRAVHDALKASDGANAQAANDAQAAANDAQQSANTAQQKADGNEQAISGLDDATAKLSEDNEFSGANEFTGANEFKLTPTVEGDPLVRRTRMIATVRQTTERGPIDSSGKPDVLEAGTGLQVQTKGISSSTPLVVVLTLNDDEDYRVRITSNLGSVTLADDTDDQQIVLDVTPGQAPSLVVTPVWTFDAVPPSTPATGDVWYNIRHWGLPQEWDGSEWVDKYYAFPLGEASTSGESVVEQRPYAYLGRDEVTLHSGGTFPAAIPRPHFMGLPSNRFCVDYSIIEFLSPQGGYSVGDAVKFDQVLGGGVSGRFTIWFEGRRIIGLSRDATTLSIVTKGGSSAVNLVLADTAIIAYLKRSF